MRFGPVLALCTGLLAAPVAQAAQPGSVARAVGQPFRDLSLIQDKLPDALKRAAESPYEISRAANCALIQLEITDLDAALGPDIDELGADSLAADLIGGVVKLPFRSILRRVSGAQAREEAMRAAVLAGMVRRGFLKGRLSQLACPAV